LLIAAGLLAISVYGFAALANDYDPRAQVKEIMLKLPAIRKLQFKKDVPLDLKTAAQVRDYMSDQLQAEKTPEEIQDDTDEGVMLAFWPRNFLPEKVSLNLELSLLLGFYEPDSRRMVLLDGDDAAVSQVVDGDGKPIAFPYIREMTLAHELTHALQDQNFDLSRIKRIQHDEDRQLAFQSIVEGDATLTGLIYTFKGMKSAQALQALSELINVGSARPREMVSVPDTLTIPGGFVYGAGTRFVAYAYKRAGFNAVNELLRNPPTSTREILNPEKFFGHPSPPAQIDIHGYEKPLAGWKIIDENTMGEIVIVAMIHQNLGDAENWAPLADSWRADKFIVLKDGVAKMIIGFIVFGDAEMAAHFAETYSHILDQVNGDRVPHLVDKHDKAVLIFIGGPAQPGSALTQAIWRETKFGAAPVPETPPSKPARVARLE
jgi:hypothetical protein